MLATDIKVYLKVMINRERVDIDVDLSFTVIGALFKVRQISTDYIHQVDLDSIDSIDNIDIITDDVSSVLLHIHTQ